MAKNTKKSIVFGAICFFIVFLIYGKTLTGDFLTSDGNINDFYHTVFGAHPAIFHLVNLIAYSLTGFAIFVFIKRLFKKEIIGYLSAILFLVLPIHSETVANAAGVETLLVFLFSILVFLELTKEKIVFWRAGIWLVLALISGKMAFATLAIALFIIFLKEKRINKKVFKKHFRIICSFAAAVPTYVLVHFLFLKQGAANPETGMSALENPLKFSGFFSKISTALKISAMYIQKTVWPANLCSDYSYNQIPTTHGFFNIATISGLLIIILLIALSFFFFRRLPILSFASFLFLLSFLPVSNLFFSIKTIANEKLIYYPSLGIVLFLSVTFVIISNFKPQKFFGYFAISLFLVLIISYGAISFIKAGDWLTEKILIQATAKCAPNSAVSRSNLGTMYYFEGKLNEAKKELLVAKEIYNNYPRNINNLGLVYWKLGDKEKAKEMFLKAVNINPLYRDAYENLKNMDLNK